MGRHCLNPNAKRKNSFSNKMNKNEETDMKSIEKNSLI